VSDHQLRSTRRSALQGDPAAQSRHLAQRWRAGDLTRDRLLLAAYLGHQPAAECLGVSPQQTFNLPSFWIAEQGEGLRARWIEQRDWQADWRREYSEWVYDHGQPFGGCWTFVPEGDLGHAIQREPAPLERWVHGLALWGRETCGRAAAAAALAALDSGLRGLPGDGREGKTMDRLRQALVGWVSCSSRAAADEMGNAADRVRAMALESEEHSLSGFSTWEEVPRLRFEETPTPEYAAWSSACWAARAVEQGRLGQVARAAGQAAAKAVEAVGGDPLSVHRTMLAALLPWVLSERSGVPSAEVVLLAAVGDPVARRQLGRTAPEEPAGIGAWLEDLVQRGEHQLALRAGAAAGSWLLERLWTEQPPGSMLDALATVLRVLEEPSQANRRAAREAAGRLEHVAWWLEADPESAQAALLVIEASALTASAPGVASLIAQELASASSFLNLRDTRALRAHLREELTQAARGSGSGSPDRPRTRAARERGNLG
jgi:hypothetical protein